MAVDLFDYVESLRREVTQPGSDAFAGVSDEVFAGYLMDAFWEARLDGLLTPWTVNEDGVVTPVLTDGVDISRDQIALVLVYAGIKVLRNTLISTNTKFKAKAGPVEFETENSAVLLREMLRQLKEVKDRLLLDAREEAYVGLTNAYFVRSIGHLSNFYGDFLEVEA